MKLPFCKAKASGDPKIPYLAVLLAPVLLFLIGFFLNQACIAFNGTKMPVIVPYCSDLHFDKIHYCATPKTHLQILADIFVTDGGIMSIGDVFMEMAQALSLPFLIAWLVMTVTKFTRKNSF